MGETLSILPVAPAIRPVDALSAIDTIQALTRRGVIDPATVAKSFFGTDVKAAKASAAQSDLSTAAANADAGLVPLRAKVAAGGLDNELALQPTVLQARQAELGKTIALAPGEIRAGNAKNTFSASQDEAATGLIKPRADLAALETEGATAAAKAKLQYTPREQAYAAQFEKETGLAMPTTDPTDPNSPFDFEQAHKTMSQMFALKYGVNPDELDGTSTGVTAAQRKRILDRAIELKIPTLDESGAQRPLQDVVRDIQNGGPLTTTELKASAASIRNLKTNLKDLETARQAIKANPGIVGTGYTEGTPVGRMATTVLAGLGRKASQKSAEAYGKIDRFLNSSILATAADMGLSARVAGTQMGLKMEKGTVPDTGNTNAEGWLAWLDDRERKLKTALEAHQQLIKGAPESQRTAVGDLTDVMGTFASPEAAAAKPQGTIDSPYTVATKADYDALPPGAYYKAADGNTYQKGKLDKK